jgi:hypothetical protein
MGVALWLGWVCGDGSVGAIGEVRRHADWRR